MGMNGLTRAERVTEAQPTVTTGTMVMAISMDVGILSCL